MRHIKKAEKIEKSKQTFLYEYGQNNSGGHHHVDKTVSVLVYVEAKDAEEADRAAQYKAGIYFNGCDEGNDCPCCGDRWYEAYSPLSKKRVMFNLEVPSYTSKFKYNVGEYYQRWVKPGDPFCYIYYLNGDIETIYTEDEYKETFEALLAEGRITFPEE